MLHLWPVLTCLNSQPYSIFQSRSSVASRWPSTMSFASCKMSLSSEPKTFIMESRCKFDLKKVYFYIQIFSEDKQRTWMISKWKFELICAKNLVRRRGPDGRKEILVLVQHYVIFAVCCQLVLAIVLRCPPKQTWKWSLFCRDGE